jgi:hypothetical protein
LIRKGLETSHKSTTSIAETDILLRFGGSGSGAEPGLRRKLKLRINVEGIEEEEDLGLLHTSICKKGLETSHKSTTSIAETDILLRSGGSGSGAEPKAKTKVEA